MPIDRRALVTRHDVVLTAPDVQSPLTVGNGDFACTVDVTGMQTFTEFHDPRRAGSERLVTNTCTQSSWGWHEMPSAHSYALADAVSLYPTARGAAPYPDRFDLAEMLGAPTAPDKAAGTWLHMNPQRLDLGRVGLLLRPQHDGEPERNPAVLEDVHQRLRLWSGIIDSSFKYAGERVRVVTAAHPERAAVAFRIESALLTSGRLGVSVAFPYASATFNLTADWDAVDRHRTDVETCDHSARAMRTLDGMTYTVDLLWNAATLVVAAEPHHLELVAHANRLDLVVTYSEGGTDVTPATVDDVVDAAAGWWEAFWLHGAAVDFSRCSDPRAAELERRVVLSQYLTAVHCAGSAPPQETGLVTNSWGGKFHLEMHWWHAAHFVQWGRPELLRHSLSWYEVILPVAQATARRQGYEGARWPKQVGPDGRESPGEIGPFLVWQQPHLLYFAELLHAADPTSAVLDEFAEIVAQTATFMASFVEQRDDAAYHLAPPLLPAQEFYDRRTTEDPTFELAVLVVGTRDRATLARTSRHDTRCGLVRRADTTRTTPPARRPVHGGRLRALPRAQRPPIAYRRPWCGSPDAADRRRSDARHTRRRPRRLGVELRVGLGLPDARNDRDPPRRVAHCGRRAAQRPPEEQVSR